MRGDDVEALVLGNVNVGHVFGSAEEEEREDHAVDGLVSDNYDARLAAGKKKGFAESAIA